VKTKKTKTTPFDIEHEFKKVNKMWKHLNYMLVMKGKTGKLNYVYKKHKYMYNKLMIKHCFD
jgi:hypothetical protein